MFTAIFLAAALMFTPSDARVAYETARRLVERCTPRDAGTIRGRIASNLLLDAASAVGANVRRDTFQAMTPKGEREFSNLYAEFSPGYGDEDLKWVVLVAHYDTKPGVDCPGANDGASTAGLLVGIANAFSNWRNRRGKLMLVWTDGEECMSSYAPNDGLWGSRRAAEYLHVKERKVRAVICLDMLGDKDLAISVPKNGSAVLGKIAIHAARRSGYEGLVKLVDDIVTDDHVPFIEKGYHAIDLIDFSYGPGNSFWHTDKDNMDNISEESLLASGRIVTELLNILL